MVSEARVYGLYILNFSFVYDIIYRNTDSNTGG